MSPTHAKPTRRGVLGIAARLLPHQLATDTRLLRYRLHDRPIWLHPDVITAKPGPEGSWDEVKQRDIGLLKRMDAEFVVDGEWDRQTRPFHPSSLIEDLFVGGIAPEATPHHERMVRAMAEGDTTRSRGATSLAEVDEYFERLVQLHDAMARDGFLSQRQLGQRPSGGALVCISRSGQPLLLRNGNHRTAIAKSLRLPAMPVYVSGVHPGWIDRCKERYATSNPVRATELGLTDLARTPAATSPLALDAEPAATGA